MANVHPIYHVKELMIKRELAKDPELVGESWDRFLPHFKTRNLSKRRKPFKVTDKTKKVYTPFPPPQEKSKIDLQIESGEYFLSKQAKERAQREERAPQKAAAVAKLSYREQREKEELEAEIPRLEAKLEALHAALEDLDKTAAAFIEDPPWLTAGAPGYLGRTGRLYKTGDLVKYACDGKLICVGRKDSQVKGMQHKFDKILANPVILLRVPWRKRRSLWIGCQRRWV